MYNKYMPNLPQLESPSLRLHRRQRFWQIFFPILLFVLLILVVAVVVALAVSGESTQTGLWTNVSLIWLITPMLVFALLLLLILGLLIYAVRWLTHATPRVTSKGQFYARRISGGAHRLADWSVQPFVWLKQFGAAVESLFKKS